MADEVLVDDVFKDFQPDYVIHSAAAYKDPMDWAEDSRTNVIGSVNVAKAALENGVQRLINFQTALCYGRPTSIPIPIDHPTQPFTSYGISKTAGEAYLHEFRVAYSLSAIGKYLRTTACHRTHPHIL